MHDDTHDEERQPARLTDRRLASAVILLGVLTAATGSTMILTPVSGEVAGASITGLLGLWAVALASWLKHDKP
jgi:hypothetical protein